VIQRLHRLRTGAAAIVIVLLVQAGGAQGPTPLSPGETTTLTVRWAVEDGYYMPDNTPSSLAFAPAGGVRVEPGSLETSGRLIGVSEQNAKVVVAEDAPAATNRLKVAAVIYFCSSREQWCKRITRSLELPVTVAARKAGEPPPVLELELPVPLDAER
jgi:hypothetical protein